MIRTVYFGASGIPYFWVWGLQKLKVWLANLGHKNIEQTLLRSPASPGKGAAQTPTYCRKGCSVPVDAPTQIRKVADQSKINCGHKALCWHLALPLQTNWLLGEMMFGTTKGEKAVRQMCGELAVDC